MHTDEIIKKLQKRSDKLSLEAVARLEAHQGLFKQLTLVNLNESNCASLEVATKRIRNFGKQAIDL